MGDRKKESTNGGSGIFFGGQTIIDESENTVVMPPDASKAIETSKNPKDFITIKLIPNREKEQDDLNR